jgi:hypothetical protein
MSTLNRAFCPAAFMAAPLLALLLIASLPSPADSGQGMGQAATCGPAVAIRDPEILRSFARFDAGQSAASQKICTIFRDDAAGLH